MFQRKGLSIRFVLITLSCLLVGSAVWSEDLVIRVKVDASDGTKVEGSAPLGLLEVIKSSVSLPFLNKDEFNPLVDALIQDLESIKGRDLLRVEAEDKVRVWVDEVDDDHPEEINFVQFMVDPADDDEPTIQVCLPKGLFFLISNIGDQFMKLYGEQIFSAIQQHQPPFPIPPHFSHHGMKQDTDEEEVEHECAEEAEQEDVEVEHDDEDDDEDEDEEISDLENLKKEILKQLIEKLTRELEKD